MNKVVSIIMVCILLTSCIADTAQSEMKTIGRITVATDSSIYSSPNSDDKLEENIKANESIDIYQKLETDDVIWYQIGKDKWIKEDKKPVSAHVDLTGINSDNFEEYVNGKYFAFRTYDKWNSLPNGFVKEFCVFKFNIDGNNLHFEKYDFTNNKPVYFSDTSYQEIGGYRYGFFTFHYNYAKNLDYQKMKEYDLLAIYEATNNDLSDENPEAYLSFKYEGEDVLQNSYQHLALEGYLYDNLEQVLENETIGTITITANKINKRTYHSTISDIVGEVKKGETCNVFEIENSGSDGYTWYQIGYTQWIADDGTWLTYTPKE